MLGWLDLSNIHLSHQIILLESPQLYQIQEVTKERCDADNGNVFIMSMRLPTSHCANHRLMMLADLTLHPRRDKHGRFHMLKCYF